MDDFGDLPDVQCVVAILLWSSFQNSLGVLRQTRVKTLFKKIDAQIELKREPRMNKDIIY